MPSGSLGPVCQTIGGPVNNYHKTSKRNDPDVGFLRRPICIHTLQRQTDAYTLRVYLMSCTLSWAKACKSHDVTTIILGHLAQNLGHLEILGHLAQNLGHYIHTYIHTYTILWWPHKSSRIFYYPSVIVPTPPTSDKTWGRQDHWTQGQDPRTTGPLDPQTPWAPSLVVVVVENLNFTPFWLKPLWFSYITYYWCKSFIELVWLYRQTFWHVGEIFRISLMHPYICESYIEM